MEQIKSLIKRVLAIGPIRRVYNFVMRSVAKLGAINRLTSTLYYIPSFLTFSREQYAVLRGRRSYYTGLGKQRATRAELRRNIHRLEKALLMRPRRDTFAKDYIGETVEFYQKAIADHETNADVDESELVWAQNVLSEYFRAISVNDKVIDRAREQFAQVSYSPSEADKVPYERGVPKSDVSYDDFLKLSQQRRSVRWFKQKKVPRKLIDQALTAARQAPSACNRLPYEYRIFDDPELVKKVAALPFGSAGYRDNIPVIAVVVGKLDSYFSPRDRHGIYIDASLSAMSFMYALETLGLASSVINWPDFEPLERKMQKTLGLKTEERPVMLLAIGYADPKGKVAYSQKKDLKVLRSYNRIQDKS